MDPPCGPRRLLLQVEGSGRVRLLLLEGGGEHLAAKWQLIHTNGIWIRWRES